MSTQPPNPESLLGAQIRVTTTFGEEIEGELFCVDTSAGGPNFGVILLQRLENGNVNYKWTKANIIREVSASAGPSGASESLPYVDVRQLEKREVRLQEDYAEQSARFGVGVTEHAQLLFDGLSRNMDAQWDGEDITIKMHGVRISKPYDPETCLSLMTGGKSEALEYVKTMLQAEMDQLNACMEN